jgi:hypothetical protein
MSKIKDILCKNDLNTLELHRKKALKKVIAQLLIQNLLERLSNRNILPTMKGKHIVKIKLDHRGFYQWVRPYVHNNRLLFEIVSNNWFTKGTRIEASDIFGPGINKIRLPKH